ncbi:MAG TPA: nucleotide exchange factor GrpE [Candidatus Paceibacterota bacterium]
METRDEEFVSEEPSFAEASKGDEALKRLREKLKKAVEEKQEYLEGWQRARADFANYKAQEASMHGDKEERTKAQLIEELMPALDTLELSLKHHDAPELKMLEKQFLDSLKRLGIERFGRIGEEFDPKLHEALAKKSEDHIITSIERSGYKINNQTIRPAQVII